MTAPLGPIRSDDFESVLKEAVQECYASGVRLRVIAKFFGISTPRVSQLATPALRTVRDREIARREEAIIMRRLGELKLRLGLRGADADRKQP